MIVTDIKREKDYDFPVLLENPRYGTIILATGWTSETKENYRGVCLRTETGSEIAGDDRSYWRKDAFIKFRGKLMLEQ